MRAFWICCCGAAMLTAQTALAQNEGGQAAQKIEHGQLGSMSKPIRVNGPRGEQDYLSRSRCADGSQPQFERLGDVGDGPDGDILDLYAVQCSGSRPVEVYMDMYHRRPESRPISGFTLVR